MVETKTCLWFYNEDFKVYQRGCDAKLVSEEMADGLDYCTGCGNPLENIEGDTVLEEHDYTNLIKNADDREMW